MQLQTQIPLEKQSKNVLDYNSNVLLLGSCFSDNIGKKLDYFKFQNIQNPFGILFHPTAIETLIEKAINKNEYTEDAIFFQNEQWHCFDVHSRLSNISKNHLLDTLNSKVLTTYQQIKKSSHIIITLGTSWVYRFIETDRIVANCHKVPQKQFKKELLSVDAVSNALEKILSLIRLVNDGATVIFTVSPVRHIKDGFIENSRSKAHLITAIHDVINRNGALNEVEAYFPSYEIMMDELRDYRFYVKDMIHPSSIAIDYIWERFQKVWMSYNAIKTMEDVDRIQKGLQHKPFNPQSVAHQQFLQNLESKKHKLQVQFPHIVF